MHIIKDERVNVVAFPIPGGLRPRLGLRTVGTVAPHPDFGARAVPSGWCAADGKTEDGGVDFSGRRDCIHRFCINTENKFSLADAHLRWTSTEGHQCPIVKNNEQVFVRLSDVNGCSTHVHFIDTETEFIIGVRCPGDGIVVDEGAQISPPFWNLGSKALPRRTVFHAEHITVFVKNARWALRVQN